MQVYAVLVSLGQGEHGLRHVVELVRVTNAAVGHVCWQLIAALDASALQHVFAQVGRASNEPCLLMLDALKASRCVYQLHEHALRSVFRVGCRAQVRVRKPIHHLYVAAIDVRYVGATGQVFSFALLRLIRFSSCDCRVISPFPSTMKQRAALRGRRSLRCGRREGMAYCALK